MGCIDDSFYTKDTIHRCQEATLHAVQLFIKLGFVVHPTKSVFQPTQSLEFLAFVLDSILMRVAISKVKVDYILALCRSFLVNRSFTIRHVASLIGTLLHESGKRMKGSQLPKCLKRERKQLTSALQQYLPNID